MLIRVQVHEDGIPTLQMRTTSGGLVGSCMLSGDWANEAGGLHHHVSPARPSYAASPCQLIERDVD
jgi:hypothetical protein